MYGKCISTDGFLTTAVFSGKLQHKVSYLEGSKDSTQISHDFQFWTPGTSYTLHYSLGSLLRAVVSPKAPRSSRNRLFAHRPYMYMLYKVNWGNSGHGVTPDISSFQACNSDKKKRITFRLGVKTVLLLTFL